MSEADKSLMSEADLPAIAVEAVRARLETAIADLPGQPSVLASSPWRAPEYGLFVHLHALAVAQPLGSGPVAGAALPAGRAQGPRGWKLHMLIGAFAPEEVAIHRLMARAAAVLDTDPSFGQESLREAARQLGLNTMAMTGRVAQLLRDDISLEDMTRLWRRFAPMRYSLSGAWRLDLA